AGSNGRWSSASRFKLSSRFSVCTKARSHAS
ncbi:ABC transporter ATP-binding protein uup, partial [Vibrio parahaemolyticus EKP-008]